jgi:hypothetical protein
MSRRSETDSWDLVAVIELMVCPRHLYWLWSGAGDELKCSKSDGWRRVEMYCKESSIIETEMTDGQYGS